MEYDTLVLSGGGFRGIAQLGCLDYLYKQKKLIKVKTFIGTSIGAIINYLLIIGFTPQEIVSYICCNDIVPNVTAETNKVLSSLLTILVSENKLDRAKDILSKISKYGIFDYNKIYSTLETMTRQKLDLIPTLEELYYITEKTLIVCTYKYNNNNGKACYISYKTNPTLNCLDALRMSSNIPLIFGEYSFEDYKYIDGGIIDNFPINYKHDEKDKEDKKEDKKDKKDTYENKIGITVLGGNLINSNNILLNVLGIAFLPLYDREASKIKSKNVINIRTQDISPNSSIEEKMSVYREGYNQTIKHFKKEKKD